MDKDKFLKKLGKMLYENIDNMILITQSVQIVVQR